MQRIDKKSQIVMQEDRFIISHRSIRTFISNGVNVCIERNESAYRTVRDNNAEVLHDLMTSSSHSSAPIKRNILFLQEDTLISAFEKYS